MAKKRERDGAGKEVGGEREKKAKSAAVGRHIGAVDAPIADVPFTTGDAQLALAGNAAPAGAHSPRHARATSRFRGVTHHVRTGRFEAYCWAQGSQVYLGGFAEEEQAALAVDIAMVKFRGLAEAATRTNFDVSGFADELGSLDGVSNDELVLFLRRQSKCFAASPAAAAAEAARAASADADASGDARAAAVDASAGSETLAGGSNSKGLYAYRGVHRLSSGKFEARVSVKDITRPMRLSRRTVKKKGKAKAGGSSTERSTPAYTLPVSKGSHVKLGTFDTAELAASAYDRELVQQRGHHACTNFGLTNYEAEMREHNQAQREEAAAATAAASLELIAAGGAPDPRADHLTPEVGKGPGAMHAHQPVHGGTKSAASASAAAGGVGLPTASGFGDEVDFGLLSALLDDNSTHNSPPAGAHTGR
eukprot:PRCOL_00002509-RA